MWREIIVLGGLGVLVLALFGDALWKAVVLFLGWWTVIHLGPGWRQVWMVIRRDSKFMVDFLKLKVFAYKCQRFQLTVPKMFMRTASKFPHRVMFIHEDRKWTFKEVDEFSNRVANSFWSMGFREGDEVSLLMESKPEFIGCWLGLAKIGVITALINNNLKATPLQHSITVIRTKAVICGAEHWKTLCEVIPSLQEQGIKDYLVYGDFQQAFGAKSLQETLDHASPDRPTFKPKAGFQDPLFYVYTSGTTGLPKAAVIKNVRYMLASALVPMFLGLTPNDVIYIPLPLYHVAGGVLASSQSVLFGTTAVLRGKFSASQFWKDCVKYRCTATQYIGETCRYLLATPPCPEEKQHHLRLLVGNGLRPEIWREFATRFNIPRICEFYGSTEGNTNLANLDGTVGAVGFIPLLVPSSLLPISIIRVDEVTGEPIRDEKGFCIRCKPDEPGEIVGVIRANHPFQRFDGYRNKEATSKKILHDVFEKGDAVFRSGDILVKDRWGYLYFKDRTGDTFRWRGENVSTTEVEGCITEAIGPHTNVVYGVEVPGQEGRAGMAAIMDPEGKVSLERLLTGLRRSLPPYAIPLFVRFVKELEVTGTYKVRKVDLQKEGFEPSKVKGDRLYYINWKDSKYCPLDNAVYQEICAKKVKL